MKNFSVAQVKKTLCVHSPVPARFEDSKEHFEEGCIQSAIFESGCFFTYRDQSQVQLLPNGQYFIL